MLGKLWQAVCRATDQEGGGLLPGEVCTKTGRPVADVLFMENLTCTAFEEYEEVPETVSLDLSEDDVMWVASKVSGVAGAMGQKRSR